MIHKLIDLGARWAGFGVPGLIDGVTFLCPHCVEKGIRTQRLGVTFSPPIDPEGWWDKISQPTYAGRLVWKRERGETFETLTLSPSLNMNEGRIDFDNHWHGHIKDGLCV